MENEIWKDIPGYEGMYQSSTIGRIKSLNRYVKHYSGGNQIVRERIIKQGSDGNGYLKVMLCKNGTKKVFHVHRLIALAFLGESELQIDHIDRIKSNNNIKNLEYVSRHENQKRRFFYRKYPTGVYPVRNKFRSMITLNNKHIHLGYYDNIKDAEIEYIKAKNIIENGK